jgi:hypothetical protein
MRIALAILTATLAGGASPSRFCLDTNILPVSNTRFVSRASTAPRSFDNRILRRMRIDVQIVGDDYANLVAGNYSQPPLAVLYE